MSTQINLPLTLETGQNFDIFFRALNDWKVREGLMRQEASTVPAGVRELCGMIDDRKFLSIAENVATRYQAMKRGQTTVDNVRDAGEELANYINRTYPAGSQLLRAYATRMAPEILRGKVEVNVDVAANVEAVVNVAVWSNAAVATHVIVAAAAVVFAAVFVAGGTNV